MTTQEMLEQLPANTPDEEELQALFGREDMQHHLYGVHIPAADSYPEPEPAHWHCTCSACGQVFAVQDNRRLKDITVCPKCGAAVAPHRWTVPQRGKRINAFLFYHLFRGQGRSIWVRSWKVSQWLTAEGQRLTMSRNLFITFMIMCVRNGTWVGRGGRKSRASRTMYGTQPRCAILHIHLLWVELTCKP